MSTATATTPTCLQSVPNGTGTLAPTTGKRLVSEAKAIFAGYIDGDFVRYRANGPTAATGEMGFTTDKLVKNAAFGTMFAGSGFFTPDQFIELCDKHPEVLSRTGATFVPLEVLPEGVELAPDADRSAYRFVASVRVDERKLSALVGRFSVDGVWYAKYGYRVVRPQAS